MKVGSVVWVWGEGKGRRKRTLFVRKGVAAGRLDHKSRAPLMPSRGDGGGRVCYGQELHLEL